LETIDQKASPPEVISSLVVGVAVVAGAVVLLVVVEGSEEELLTFPQGTLLRVLLSPPSDDQFFASLEALSRLFPPISSQGR